MAFGSKTLIKFFQISAIGAFHLTKMTSFGLILPCYEWF